MAYGIIGSVHTNAYPGFNEGDLITVVGDTTGYFIKQINGNATASFNNSENVINSNNCNSNSANYAGELGYHSSNFYTVNIFNTTDGSIQLSSSSGNQFNAGWSEENKILDSFSIATIGSVHTNAYQNFNEGDEAFVTDIGNGIAITALDSFTGKIKATAVFIKQ